MTQHFPWPQYRRPWTLDIAVRELAMTGTAGTADVDEERCRIRLDGVEDWDAVVLDLRLTTGEELPEGVERPETYVLVTAARSNLRLPVQMHASHGDFVGSCRLARSLLAGVVDIRGHVVTASADPRPTRVIGESNAWSLVVDAGDAPPTPGGPPFEAVRTHFSAPDAPAALREASSSFALMDVTGPEPVLYLNQDFTGLEHVLDAKSAKLEKRRLRDLMGAQIAHHAASTLFREALARSDVDGEEVALPDDKLSRQVCRAIADVVPSVEDAEDLVRALRDGETRRALVWMEVENAITVLTGLGDAVARSVEEVHLA